eukprot:scaffold29618_cov183-Amphora_coffeaeformis.AAC.6
MSPPRLDDNVLYRSEVDSLDNNSTSLTRFDYPRVSSSPEDLHLQFSILGTVNLLVAFSCGLLILGILRSRRVGVSKGPFDLYLLFIALPDFISGFSCMLTCWMSAPEKSYVSEEMCGYQAFYLNATVAANTWMNAVIIYQIHKLLRYSNVRRRYIPPTTQQACCHAAIVYAYAILWGVLCGMQVDLFGMPFNSHALSGLYCIPMEEKGNSWFYYLAFLPGIFILPSLYALAIMAHILLKGMLPGSGRRRVLALFLIRIIFLYIAVFLPLSLSLLIGNFVYFESNWAYYIPAVMTHLQGILTTLLVYFTNPKIAESMKKVLQCDWTSTGSGGSDQELSSNGFSKRYIHGRLSQGGNNKSSIQSSHVQHSSAEHDLNPEGGKEEESLEMAPVQTADGLDTETFEAEP